MKFSYKAAKFSVLGVALLGGFSVALLQSGCALYEPGNVNETRISVSEDKVVEQIPLSSLNGGNGVLVALAKHYRRVGDGAMDLTLTYDPAVSGNNTMKATDEATEIVKFLRKQGINQIDTNILPIKDQGLESYAVVSFKAYKANPPKDCEMLAGFDSPAAQVHPDYKLGCTVDTVITRQIARPKDLLGRGQQDPTSDGRRSSNIIEVYRTGEPNAPLGGESASGE